MRRKLCIKDPNNVLVIVPGIKKKIDALRLYSYFIYKQKVRLHYLHR